MENGEACTLSDGGENDPRPEHRLSLFSYYLGTTVLLLRPLYSVPGKEFLISICKLLPIVYLGTYICRYTRMECRSVHQVAIETWNYLSTTSLPVLAPAGRLCLPPPLPLTADPPQSLFPLALQDPVQLLLLHPIGSSIK